MLKAESQTIAAVVQTVCKEYTDTGYTIFVAHPEGSKFPKRDRFKATGNVGSLREGERIILKGKWVEHKRFGWQFDVDEMELPDFSGDSILGFLTSGYLKGVGPALANRIFEAFGERTSEVLDNSPEDMLQVKGVGKKKLGEIISAWQETRGKREALSVFSKIGLGPMTIQKILKRWQNPRDAIANVQKNPYLLAWEIHGVGFLQADRIARNLNFDLKHPLRVQASIGFALKMAADSDGHCYLSREQLFSAVNKLLNPDNPDGTAFDPSDIRLIEDNLNTLLFKQKIIEDNGCVYLTAIYRAEQEFAASILRLNRGQGGWKEDLAAKLNEYQRTHSVDLHENQAAAVANSLLHKVSIITGGPGTGKTTILRALLSIAKEGIDQTRIRLAAPTGRAAKRMAESTSMPASTVHRLLEFAPGNGGYAVNKDNPLAADMVIVDEASMLDIFLARSLAAALPSSCRLVLVGDVDQLPSVGPGSVLKDLIRSGAVSTTKLTKIFRQAGMNHSYISANAAAVNAGSMRSMFINNKESEDFKWWGIEDTIHEQTESPDKAATIQRRILKSVVRAMELGYSPQEIQVLSPTFKGTVGVKELNVKLQALFNPKNSRVEIGRGVFAIGDRVMQSKNNYDLNVLNGDQGYIVEIDETAQIVVIDYEGREVEYEFSDMDEVMHAYAITVHKSQGSESPVIIQPVSTCQFLMLQRNLLYTGITRAKRLCVLIGEKKALGMAIRNNKIVQRNTCLSRRIQ